MRQKDQAVKSTGAIPGPQVALPFAIEGQVIILVANRGAAAPGVAPRALLAVDDIQQNEIGGHDNGPVNSG
jgi:hypothetical protein